jgi:hypothetical protein
MTKIRRPKSCIKRSGNYWQPLDYVRDREQNSRNERIIKFPNRKKKLCKKNKPHIWKEVDRNPHQPYLDNNWFLSSWKNEEHRNRFYICEKCGKIKQVWETRKVNEKEA